MLPIWAYALIAAVLFGSGAAAGHKVTHNAWEAAQAEQETALREKYVADVKEANARADEAERKVEAIRASTRVVTRTVDRIVERPVYRNVCLDPDGLRIVGAAARGEAPDPGEPDKPVPPTDAPR